MKRKLQLRWKGLIVLLLFFCLLPASPNYAHDAQYDPSVLQPHLPITQPKLVEHLRGTTRQAERIATAIEAGHIQVEMLSIANFTKQYRRLGGEGHPVAYAYGNRIYLHLRSSRILCELVHEGTHALDSLSGRDFSRLRLEFRAYYYARQFQQAAGAEPDFDTLIEMVLYVCELYG